MAFDYPLEWMHYGARWTGDTSGERRERETDKERETKIESERVRRRRDFSRCSQTITLMSSLKLVC